MSTLVGLLGILALLAISYAMSSNRKAVSLRVVVSGLVIQLVLALLLLKVPGFHERAQALGDGIRSIVDFSVQGAAFVLGDDLVNGKFRFFAVVGSTIIVMSALSSVLYYTRVLEFVVRGLAWVMRRTMRITGIEALSSAASIFAGQVESQTLIRPYVPTATRSQLFTMLSVNMATIAGTVLVTYTAMGMDPVYLILASIISAPAGIVIAKIMEPETDLEKVAEEETLKLERKGSNVFDAFAIGVQEGAQVAANVMVMLIAAVAFVAMANAILAHGLPVFGGIILLLLAGIVYTLVRKGWAGKARMFVLGSVGVLLVAGVAFTSHMGLPLTVENIGGVLMTPIAFMIGVPANESFEVGRMMATEILVNEFVSYKMLATSIADGSLTPKTQLIATIALCGFANLGSIAINIGGLGAMAPERRGEIALLGAKALVAANMATWLTAAVAGILF